MNKTQLFNVAAWTFIIIGVILLIWKIFGNSPAEFNILTASFKHLASDFKDHASNKRMHK